MKHVWISFLVICTLQSAYGQSCIVKGRTLDGFDIPNIQIVSYHKSGKDLLSDMTILMYNMGESGATVSQKVMDQAVEGKVYLKFPDAEDYKKYLQPTVFSDKASQLSYGKDKVIRNMDEVNDLKALLVAPKQDDKLIEFIYENLCDNMVILIPKDLSKFEVVKPLQPAPTKEPSKPKKNRIKTPYNRKVSGLA